MSKPVKALIRESLASRLKGVSQLAVVGFTGVDAITANHVRARLRQKDIRITVVKNALARQAFQAVGLAKAGELLNGPCALAYGADGVVTVVREIREMGKEAPGLVVKAAYMDGQVFAFDRIEALSRYPTRQEAVAQVVQCILSAAARLAACLIGPGGQLAGVLKTIEDRQTGCGLGPAGA